MKKKFMVTLMTALVALQGTAYAGTIPKVNLNGNKIFLKQSPQILDNTTYVPLRTVEALGANVSWDESTQTATIQHGYNTIQQRVNSDTMRLNNTVVASPAPAKRISGTVFLPIKSISEVFGANVNYDKKNNIINIDYKFSDTMGLDFDTFGRVIKQGKAPLNNAKDYQNYKVVGVDESIYKHPTGYNAMKWNRTPKEGTTTENMRQADFIRPKNMYLYERYDNDKLKQWVSVTEKYLDLMLNVDYRTIDDKWAYEMATTLYQDPQDEYFQKYLNDCKKYVKYIKDNKIIIEGDYFVEPTTAHYSSGNKIAAWVKYKGNKDFKFNEIAEFTKKGGKTYEGFTTIDLGNNVANNDGSNLRVRGSYVGSIGEK